MAERGNATRGLQGAPVREYTSLAPAQFNIHNTVLI